MLNIKDSTISCLPNITLVITFRLLLKENMKSVMVIITIVSINFKLILKLNLKTIAIIASWYALLFTFNYRERHVWASSNNDTLLKVIWYNTDIICIIFTTQLTHFIQLRRYPFSNNKHTESCVVYNQLLIFPLEKLNGEAVIVISYTLLWLYMSSCDEQHYSKKCKKVNLCNFISNLK